MRTYLLAAVALLGCRRESAPSPSPTPVSPKHADALWALAPAELKIGIIATPRALQLVEGGAAAVQGLLAIAPELADARAVLDGAMTDQFGGPIASLAEIGIDHDRGFAVFVTAIGPVTILPIGDRAKLHARFQLGADAGPAKLGSLICKPLADLYACAETDAALATIGKVGQGQLPASLAALGARGDIEVFANEGPVQVAAVVQLERGAGVVRGAAVVPPALTANLGMSSKPRTDGARTTAFAVADLTPLLGTLPPAPLAGGITLADVARTVGGPITVTVAPGSVIPDVRVPLIDPAPATGLVTQCKDFIPAHLLAADQQAGMCRLTIPQYAMQLDLWVEGTELRVGTKGAPPATKQVAMTALGAELARQKWSLAIWGRGTLFGASGFGGLPDTLPAAGAMVIRGLTLLNELGMAVRLDGNKLSFHAGLRTVWANPPDVTAKLLAISPDDIARGKADAAIAIAKAAPTSPHALDYAAGQGGLMVPTAVVGLLAAVAIPAFMKYTARAKLGEPAPNAD